VTEPIETPEMLVMQERLRDLAKRLAILADRIEASENVDDAKYTAEMMRLQAEQVKITAAQLEDSDDIARVNLYVSRQEIEARRLETTLDEAAEANAKAKGKPAAHWKRRQAFWTTFAIIFGALTIFQAGFAFGRIAEAIWSK
jgi:hypothetical protein